MAFDSNVADATTLPLVGLCTPRMHRPCWLLQNQAPFFTCCTLLPAPLSLLCWGSSVSHRLGTESVVRQDPT